MYVDNELLMSNAQALTATADSTNYIDLSQDRDIGTGNPMAVVIAVSVAADFTTGNETYTFSVETDDNTSFSSATVIATKAVLTTALTAGDLVVLAIPYTNERYLQVVYTLAGTTPSVTVDAYLTPMNMIHGKKDYASGYTIS